MIVYVDVDDTIVRWAGSKAIPRTLIIERLRERAARGERLFLWSRAGDQAAREVAERLGVADLFEAFLPKPELLIDDEPITEWSFLQHEFPR